MRGVNQHAHIQMNQRDCTYLVLIIENIPVPPNFIPKSLNGWPLGRIVLQTLSNEVSQSLGVNMFIFLWFMSSGLSLSRYFAPFKVVWKELAWWFGCQIRMDMASFIPKGLLTIARSTSLLIRVG